MRVAATGAIVRGVLLVAVCGAALVSAQPPGAIYDPNVVPLQPPGTVYDPNVVPAQRLQPPVPPASIPDTARNPAGTTVPTGISVTPGRGRSAVYDPPSPAVQLQLRTPATVSVGKPVPYRILLRNTSTAKALRVKVRMPWPEGADKLAECEPKADNDNGGKELVWEVGDLEQGKTETIELAFVPAAMAKKVTARAYVSFEFGEKVETVIDAPKIEVTRSATPEVSVNELVTVRVGVTNTGTVPVPKVRLVEQAPAEAEFRGDEKAEKTNVPGQRAWELGTVAPGQTVYVQYQLLVRQPTTGEGMLTSSAASSGEATLEPAQASSRTKVLQPGLSLAFTGTQSTAPKSPALYKAVVRNVGTLPLGNIELIVDVPEGLEVNRRTNGARVDGDRLSWVIPKLSAGEAHEFTLQCVPMSGVAGKKLLKASVRDARGLVDVQTAEAGTDFVGKADLTWKPTFDKAWVQVGRRGTLTVSVKNQGAESDNAVRLRVKLPPEVKYLGNNGAIPATYENAEVLFPAQKLAPGRTTDFEVTYEGKTPGPGRFLLVLEGESFGNQPLTKEQEVVVER